MKNYLFLLCLLMVNLGAVSDEPKMQATEHKHEGHMKTFKKDKSVLAIDVDLAKGKVLVAYEKSRAIDFDEIKNKILINGQNATDLEILEI